MIKYFIFLLGFITFSLSSNAMDDYFDEEQPITPELIRKGKENYLEMQKGKEDLLALAKQGRYDEAYKSARKTALCKIEYALPEETTIEALFINVFTGSSGGMNLFTWDASKGDKNYQVLDKGIYRNGSSSVIRDARHCTGLTYSFKSLLNSEGIWVYQKDIGYEQTSMTKSIWHCTVQHIYTDEQHQCKGMATNTIRELVNFVFKSTSADFIVASVAYHRPASWKAFLKNKFIETQEIKNQDEPGFEGASNYSSDMKFITLDGGQTFILPLFYSGLEGNLYLSRYDWEKNQAQ